MREEPTVDDFVGSVRSPTVREGGRSSLAACNARRAHSGRFRWRCQKPDR